MKNETLKIKKRKQAKNLRHSEKIMGNNKTNRTENVPAHLLYLWEDGTFWVELPNWASLAESRSRSISKIRFKSATNTVLSLQYQSRGQRRAILLEYVGGDRPRSNGSDSERQTSKRKGVRSLRQTNVRLPVNFGQLKKS